MEKDEVVGQDTDMDEATALQPTMLILVVVETHKREIWT